VGGEDLDGERWLFTLWYIQSRGSYRRVSDICPKNALSGQIYENKGAVFEIPSQNIPFKGLTGGGISLALPPCKLLKTWSNMGYLPKYPF
jgi:hypothetical protein